MKRLGIAVVAGCAVMVILGYFGVSSVREQSTRLDPRLVKADNEFAFKLFREVVKEQKGENVFISPASIALALHMTYNGAGGKTREDMAKTLGIQGMTLDEVNRGNRGLMRLLANPGSGVELDVANSLWARKGVAFKPEFMRSNKRYYDAEVSTLDFDDPKAASTVSSWVEEKTHGRIKNLVTQFKPSEILHLVNAVYFNGEWSSRFDKANTRDGTFHLPNGRVKKVPMMRQSHKFQYLSGEGTWAVRLPYGKERFSMYIFLAPDISEFAGKMNPESWARWMSGFRADEEVEVELPHFTVQYKTGLERALTKLGMRSAFDDRADFHNMVPGADVWISRAYHKSWIQVDERGTEAAAATDVGNSWGAHGFTVDRPFCCVIRDDKIGLILFMGVVMDPAPDKPLEPVRQNR